jgi:hypothetical protein
MWPVDDLVAWADLGPPSRVVRRAPWASVVVWERPESSVWGKAMCPGFAAECRILPLLARRRPDKVLEPRRVDPDRGLLLLPDGGPTIDTGLDAAAWTDFIVGYAGLQQDLVGCEARLLAAGCVDLRPGAAVQRLAQHMESGAVDHRQHLVDWLGAVADGLGDEIPPTIQHDDLQPSNVLLDGRILDWGDASLAHPFASLLTALMPGNPRRPGRPAERRAMRDAYLASWATRLGLDIANPTTSTWLRKQVDLAMLLAPIGRIETWLRAPQEALLQYPDAIDRWIDHLERSYAEPTSNAL